jgi:methionyl-tRNA synthetase
LSPDELINPVSTISGHAPVKKKTTHWYLPLAKHEDFLKKWIIEEHGQDWRPSVVGQCKSWIDGGLQSRAVTRDLDWGVKVPLKDAAGKVLYVWFDAPIGYISATKQWALDNNKDWKPYWYDQDTQLVHFIGKDNIVFHCIIFPVMLKLHGNILPSNVPANEFLNLEGDKMSTSRNWKLEMRDYILDFVKKENGGDQCVDMLRYYLTQIAPESKDSEFTWKGFQDAVNSELVSIFGNYVNRTFVLMHKLCKGKVPAFHTAVADEKDLQIQQDIQQAKVIVEQALEGYKFREALFAVIDLARKGNRYMQDKEPWILAKQLTEHPERQELIDNCMFNCLQLTANLAILINPFLPSTAKKMCQMMKVVDKMLDWENAGSLKLLSVGYSLREPQLLFRKIEDEEISMQLEKLKAGLIIAQSNDNELKQENIAEPLKAEIQFDDFAKIDLRTGVILSAQKVPKADKLLQLEVDLGFEKRTILSGIAMHFQPEEVIGKQVVVVANLAPRKMRGIDSNGMILMAEDEQGKLHFVQPENRISGGNKVS